MKAVFTFTRKITPVSPEGSRYITLPKGWLDSMGLKAKDTVLVQVMDDSSLRIVPVTSEAVDVA